MELLFKREQTSGAVGRVNFKLWGKLELDQSEQELVSRYRFDDALLIEAIQPNLLRSAAFVAGGVFVVGGAILGSVIGFTTGLALGALLGAGSGYWYFNERRETIYVKDLLHGRNFTCKSVIELARKEAWLETICGFLRQVMESAKEWDGTARHPIEPLPKDQARQVIIKGI
ncbi:MAG: hypothetical protein AAF830_10125 [Pseudomonadota bacterium]